MITRRPGLYQKRAWRLRQLQPLPGERLEQLAGHEFAGQRGAAQGSQQGGFTVDFALGQPGNHLRNLVPCRPKEIFLSHSLDVPLTPVTGMHLASVWVSGCGQRQLQCWTEFMFMRTAVILRLQCMPQIRGLQKIPSSAAIRLSNRRRTLKAQIAQDSDGL